MIPLLAVLLKPGDDVAKDDLDVVIWLAGGEAVPHSWVQLYGLVQAAGLLVQCLTHLRVCHHVGFAMQYKERQNNLEKVIKVHELWWTRLPRNQVNFKEREREREDGNRHLV